MKEVSFAMEKGSRYVDIPLRYRDSEKERGRLG
jgi:hypothetical protein